MLPSIFINIASYRDQELWLTLDSLLTQARDPQRLKIVICWQDNADITLIKHAGYRLSPLNDFQGFAVWQLLGSQAEIVLMSVPYQLARGVGWARAMIDSFYGEETFYLQLDAHTRAAPHWDYRLVLAHDRLAEQSEKPIISGYPAGYSYRSDGQLNFATRANQVVFNRFTQQGIPTLTASILQQTVPRRSSFLAGGFIFTQGSFVREVGNDANIFFEGEEIGLSLRAFSWGYDVFHHPEVFFWHYYSRQGQPKIWQDHNYEALRRGEITHSWAAREKASQAYLQGLLGLTPNYPVTSDPKGLGPTRSLLAFQYQSGLCLRSASCYPECLAPSFCSYFSAPVDQRTWWQAHRKDYQQSLILNALFTEQRLPDKLVIHIYANSEQRLLVKSYPKKLLRRIIHQNQIIHLRCISRSNDPPRLIRVAHWYDNSGWQTVNQWPWLAAAGPYCLL